MRIEIYIYHFTVPICLIHLTREANSILQKVKFKNNYFSNTFFIDFPFSLLNLIAIGLLRLIFCKILSILKKNFF